MQDIYSLQMWNSAVSNVYFHTDRLSLDHLRIVSETAQSGSCPRSAAIEIIIHRSWILSGRPTADVLRSDKALFVPVSLEISAGTEVRKLHIEEGQSPAAEQQPALCCV